MKLPKYPIRMRYALILIVGVLILGGPRVASSLTNNISVATPEISYSTTDVTPDSLKPPECSGVSNITTIISGAGALTGTAGNDLILGDGDDNTIDGGDGNDCILGGAGVNEIDGGAGADVCIDSGSAPVFRNCETRSPDIPNTP